MSKENVKNGLPKLVVQEDLVYSDVIKSGWIQPYKPEYTMKDFHRLHRRFDALTSHFILLCSAAYYCRVEGKKCRCTKPFDKIEKFACVDIAIDSD